MRLNNKASFFEKVRETMPDNGQERAQQHAMLGWGFMLTEPQA